MPKFVAVPVLAAAVATLSGSFALSQIAYNDANGTYGASMHGVTTGTNFTAWNTQNNANVFTFNGGLRYPYLATSGNAVYGGGQYLTSGVGLNTAASGFAPYLTSGSLGKDGTTLWASALVNNLLGTDGYTFTLHNGTGWGGSGTQVQVRSTGGYWHLLQNGGTSVNTGVKVDPGNTALMVFKMDFQSTTSDQVTLYVNPTLSAGATTPNVTGTTLTTSSNLLVRGSTFYPGSGTMQGAVDELRFGATYQSVTPYDATATPQTAPKRMRSFMIGNSLTDDIETESLRISALSRGQMLPWARQVILGSPLDNIVNNPNGGFLTSPYNGWSNALPNYTWDVVSLEPFDRQKASDKASIKTLIDATLTNPENANTRFLIYSRWPRKNSDGTLDFQAKWDRPYDGSFGSEESRAYFEVLTDEVRQMYPGKTISMVPVGDVMYEIQNRIEAGTFTGLTDVTGLYEDGIHMNKIGSLVVGMTYYATMFKESPVGLPDTYGVNDPAMVAQVQDVVWDVVSIHPYAGVPEPTLLIFPAAALIGLGQRRRARKS